MYTQPYLYPNTVRTNKDFIIIENLESSASVGGDKHNVASVGERSRVCRKTPIPPIPELPFLDKSYDISPVPESAYLDSTNSTS